MQVFAAMVDIMDQGIGKIITTLEQKGILDNTIIFYMQDNGGCAETQGTDQPEVQPTAEQAKLKPFSYDSVFTGKKPLYSRDGRWVRNGIGVMPGDANTFTTYGMEWANVSNTPYRLYKHWTHEGGIATPLVVHWPKGITKKGEIRNQPGHLIDIMATCLAITGVQYPTKFNGNEIQPFEGKNLVPAFNNLPIDRKFIFWEHEGNRAIRTGNWKLVSTLTTLKKFTAADENKWELYDLQKDPSELNNLATKFPEKVKELAQLWEQEAIRTKAKPWPWGKQ
jgi:arylsulfatase